ncbi:MAG: hypothetical protein EPO11_07920 [Gammaproteobacteria bacterium]|nr:MAG: hypothetical protein EPO11_07920 [Gammaproteobacteria bacterium]
MPQSFRAKLEKGIEKVDTWTRVLSEIEDIFFNIRKLIFNSKSFIPIVEKFANQLGWVSLFAAALILPLNFVKIVTTFKFSEESKASQGVKTALYLGDIALSALAVTATFVMVVATVVTAAFFILAGTIKSFLEDAWDFGKALYNRFKIGREIKQEIKNKKEAIIDQLKHGVVVSENETKELTQLINRQRAYNKDLAEKGHRLIQSLVDLIGGILTPTPFVFVGMLILGAGSFYRTVDVLNLNPFKKIAQRIWNPFKELTEEEVMETLRKDYAANNASTPTVRGGSMATVSLAIGASARSRVPAPPPPSLASSPVLTSSSIPVPALSQSHSPRPSL